MKLLPIAALLIFAVALMIYKLNQYNNDRYLLKKVAWCVTDDSRTFRQHMDLIKWLLIVYQYSAKKSADYTYPNADKLSFIKEQYRISTEQEYDITKQILKEYQRDLIQKYFSGTLRERYFADYRVRKLNQNEYFLLTLYNLLHNYQYKFIHFDDKEPYEFEKEEKGYKIYRLTDYGVTFFKMYYITLIYCLTLKDNPANMLKIQIEETEKTIDTKLFRM